MDGQPKVLKKYTTEVVLQRFNGELTMLDGRNDSGGGFGGGDDGGYGGGGGQSGGMGGGGSAPTGGGSDFDDEIPF